MCACYLDPESNTNTSPTMEDDGAISSPEDSGVLDAEPTPAVAADSEEQADAADMTAADDGDEGAEEGEEGAREGKKEEEEEGMPKDPPYEYPTGLVEVDDE